ncbi:MAG: hypothetical protein ABEH35_01625 [Haloarculaceae archaeon]
MDDVLDVIDLLADFGLDGAVAWIVRIVGVLLVLAGLGLWLLTESGLLVWPAVLIGVGVLLLVGAQVLVALVDLL